ncbi:hypothetical protein H8E07_19965 [bacterium]|nr:hypothetical protein [bacterium]
MGKRSRDKGARHERWVARTLADATGLDIRRTAGQCRQGSDAPDVEAPGVWLECKVGARPDPVKAYTQGIQASDGRPVVVVWKKDRHAAQATLRLRTLTTLWPVERIGHELDGPLVTLPFDAFVGLYASVYATQDQDPEEAARTREIRGLSGMGRGVKGNRGG